MDLLNVVTSRPLMYQSGSSVAFSHSVLSVFQRRIVMLSTEMDRGIEAYAKRQDDAKRIQEHKKSLLLKPKGNLLLKK